MPSGSAYHPICIATGLLVQAMSGAKLYQRHADGPDGLIRLHTRVSDDWGPREISHLAISTRQPNSLAAEIACHGFLILSGWQFVATPLSTTCTSVPRSLSAHELLGHVHQLRAWCRDLDWMDEARLETVFQHQFGLDIANTEKSHVIDKLDAFLKSTKLPG